MRNYLLWLRYDGTHFHGWQRQKGSRSVQEDLESALARVLEGDYRLGTSSRTDAGVHAMRHPVNVLTSKTLPPRGLMRGINSLLKPDVAVIDVVPVDLSFRSRKMSCGKVYSYRYIEGWNRDPFLDKYGWRVRARLNLEAMQEAAGHFLGEHDFAAFRASKCDARTTRRHITAAVLHREDGIIRLTISGNAFLRNMVRIMAGTLADVGLGRQPPGWVAEAIASCDRTQTGMTAPARGLFLTDVNYPTDALCDGAYGW